LKKAILIIVALAVAILIVMNVSGDKTDSTPRAANENTIDWVKFDTGLNRALTDNKYVMVYFWRDG
jgi:hypothetical protein